MSSGYFSIGLYGQDRSVMDWFGLNDPFTQQLPIQITNNWSGSIWIQGQLTNPNTGASGVYTVFSGISMGTVGAGATAGLLMTWNANISGQTDTSSPVTHSLTIGLLAFTSSNYTGNLASGSVAFSNTLFSRYSGVIKVFGDIYSNDIPTPSLSLGTGGSFASGQTMSYSISYVMSGWETDVGATSNVQVTSGFNSIAVSWSSVAGAAQYFLWRWSGSTNRTLYSGGGLGTMRPIDLIRVQTTTSFTDTNVVALQADMFRHGTWEQSGSSVATFTTSPVLSSPAAREMDFNGNNLGAHAYQLNKNVSGTSLLGPYFVVFHFRVTASGLLQGLFIGNALDGYVSGTVLSNGNTLGIATTIWYRQPFYVSGSNLNTSGYFHLQLAGKQLNAIYLDDVFIVAQS